MYDAEPSAPARALHQDDLRAANRREHFIHLNSYKDDLRAGTRRDEHFIHLNSYTHHGEGKNPTKMI